jgi:hypothetical protein
LPESGELFQLSATSESSQHSERLQPSRDSRASEIRSLSEPFQPFKASGPTQSSEPTLPPDNSQVSEEPEQPQCSERPGPSDEPSALSEGSENAQRPEQFSSSEPSSPSQTAQALAYNLGFAVGRLEVTFWMLRPIATFQFDGISSSFGESLMASISTIQVFGLDNTGFSFLKSPESEQAVVVERLEAAYEVRLNHITLSVDYMFWLLLVSLLMQSPLLRSSGPSLSSADKDTDPAVARVQGVKKP